MVAVISNSSPAVFILGGSREGTTLRIMTVSMYLMQNATNNNQ